MNNIVFSKTDVLKEILRLASIITQPSFYESNQDQSIGYTMPDGKHHMFIYVDDSVPGKKSFVVEPNRVVDGAHEPMGDTASADYNDFGELMVACMWCMEQFEADRENSITPSVIKNDPLMAYIAQEVPYRLANYFDYNLSKENVAQIVSEVQNNPDTMFDYEGFDIFLGKRCEQILELDSQKIKSIKFELGNLRHELEGAIEFDSDLVPKIEKRMRDLQIELNKLLKKDFKNNNFIDDEEKMKDFHNLTKEEFLQSYSYLTEQEYDNTMLLVQKKMFIFDDELYFGQDEALKTVDGYLWATDVLVDRMKDAVKDKHSPETFETFDNINFYPIYNCWYCGIKLGGTYYYDDGTGEKMGEFELTLSEEEEAALINAMEAYCQKKNGKSCTEQLNEYRLEDGLLPIPIDAGTLVKKPDLQERIMSASERAAASNLPKETKVNNPER